MTEPRKQFLADETRFQGRYQRSLRDTLFQAYKPAMPRTILYLFVGLAGRMALLGNANLIGYWVDSLCIGKTGCHALPALFSGYRSGDFIRILTVANVLGFACTLLFRAGLSRISADAVSRIYDETTMRTSRLPMTFFDQNPSGRVMTRFTSDYNNIFRVFGGPIAEFITLVFDITSMTVLLTIASPWLLPFWALQAVLNVVVYRLFLPSLRRERRELALRRSPAIAHFAESASGANTIRAFEREAVFENRFSRLNDHFLVQRQRTVALFARFSFAMGVCTALTFLVTGIASYHLAVAGRIGIGAVGVAFAYLGLSSNVLQSFFDWLGQFEEAMTGMERMDEYLRSPLEPGAKLPAFSLFETGQPKERPSATESPLLVSARAGVPVDIHDLWLRYRPDLPPVLKGVTVSVRAGERLAVVGKTGSGKTSLVQALFRLYPVEKGAIQVAGFEADVRSAPREAADDSRRVDLHAYRSLLAYITQEPTLFLGTIRENLLAPGAQALAKGGKKIRGVLVHTDDELIDALERVQFLREQATRDEYRYWLDYQVEERGRNLSSGERQLLCMARCLLQDAPVVILDEATSAVDPRSEEILTRATDEFFKGKTQIIVAHRLSTIRSCDRVLWLQKGVVHKIGPPGEVLPEFERTELNV